VFIGGSPHAVADLWDVPAHHYNLKLTCPQCGHVRVVNAAGLWRLFRQRSWKDHLRAVPRRLACGVINRTVRPRMAIVSDEETGEPLPLPPEREWQRNALRRR
jgi:hypothetical protein